MLLALLKEAWRHKVEIGGGKDAKEIARSSSNILLQEINTKNDTNRKKLNQETYKIIQYAIISLTFMICVSSPYALYVTDLGTFDLKTIAPTLVVLFGFFILLTLSLLYIISSLKKDNKICVIVLYILAWICLALTLLGTIYNFILQGDYGVMSYFIFEKNIEVDLKHKIIDGILIVSCLIAALCLLRFKKYVILAYKILLAILVANALLSLYTACYYIFTLEHTRSEYAETKNTQDNELLDFSKHNRNILVLILDRSDGYVMHEIFKEYSYLKDSFTGFIDFTNAISSSDLTLPTLTSIIAGEQYSAININKRNVKDGLQNEIARGYAGILNAFNNNGYAVSAILDFPTDEAHLYPFLNNTKDIFFYPTFLQNMYVERYLAGLYTSQLPISQLISYGLFRNATFTMRREIYGGGMWLFNEHSIISSLKAVSEISALAEETTANATKPTFKFIHNNITHNPYSLNASCEINPKEIHSTQDNVYGLPIGHYNSEKCAWHWVSKMLKRLQDLGVYDNTEIYITADHGAQSKFIPIKVGLHIPLLYKPLNAKGEMRKDSRVIVNYDIPRLFCMNIKQKCPNVTPTTLDLLTHKKPIQIVQLLNGWHISKQNKNSFKIQAPYIFKGGNIYDASSWQMDSLDKKDSIYNDK